MAPFLDDFLSEVGYGHIQFQDNEEKSKLLVMQSRPMSLTKFIGHETLKALGLKKEIKKLLKLSRCRILFCMCEHTYYCITLEFLSSYYFEEEVFAVNFRIFEIGHCFYLKEWGNVIGCRSVGSISSIDPRDGTNILWNAITTLYRVGGVNCKFRVHMIHHPVI
ncbi:hypothetical protein vseg_010888 [Gypsophila vaccaria]